ncbi:isoprenoid biosynthesis glyoxalase ElbB [Exilibacterium tricleocarpae]|uniref:Glyoxalase n=1 Tax=Exilibacterium tricleocarpae TaxID=2591008 RepID=A0A545TZ82_9GAMM|nr:isoprenoid biosynthesis glyoxalase ElbB [Exilibacterium tricleocarpae]TQV82526.1 isoprenoid biosynthesis glyoxalase ElbB [Exilibacterium tricleocarpae]
MAKKVAVVLSGCGVFDGSEIYESVITLLRLDQRDAQVTCLAPDIEQMHVINHASGEVAEGEARNVLVEAARLARGDITDLATAGAGDYDALIVPGGFGAAKNLSDFAVRGAELTVNPALLEFARAFRAQGKPIGLICIAPVMAAAICGTGAECTIGSDADTAAAITASGAVHKTCAVDEIHIDRDRKLVTTPAYMLAGRISEAAAGINKLVDTVLDMAS